MTVLNQQGHQKLVLLFIVFLGLILRLISLNQSFWLDEAITAKVAHFSSEQILDFLKGDFNPPLYYFIVSQWQNLFGVSEISLRIPSVIFALLTILLTFKIGQIYLHNQAKLAALLLAISPLHIYYSQEARAYALTGFLFTLSILLFLKSLKAKKFWWLFSLSLLGLLFSHYQVWLALPVFPLWLILAQKGKRTKKKDYLYLALSFLPALIALLFYWPTLLSQLGLGTNISQPWKAVIGSLTMKNIALIALKFIIGRISFDNKTLYFLVGSILVFLYWGLVLLGSIKAWKKKDQEALLPMILFLPLLLGIIVSAKIPLLTYFRFLFLLPFFYLLLVKGILAIKNSRSRQIIFSLVVIVNLICSLAYLTQEQFHRENWRLVVKILEGSYSQTPVYIRPEINSAFVYYNRQKLKLISPEEFSQYHQINLISYGLAIFDPGNQVKKQLQSEGFEFVWGDSFNQVGIEKWQKKDF